LHYQRLFAKSSIINRRRYSYIHNQTTDFSINWKLLAGAVAIGTAAYLLYSEETHADTKVDYNAVREDIKKLLDSNPNYDDGSYGPVLIRLAWHAAGTYSKVDHSGGSDGASMRFHPESGHDANAGLAVARNLLEPLKQKYPGITYSDLWSLGGAVAVEAMGGPKINWRPGRVDKADDKGCTPDGRLPDAKKGPDHVSEVFYRMGFNDREIVALLGAHAVGRCHTDRSGFFGPWTQSPTVFSNDFFVQLINTTWTKKKWEGPEQYEDPSGKLMMLPADLALIRDPAFKKNSRGIR